jgi:hypothetical protein
MTKSIFIGIDDEIIELTGSKANEFLEKLAKENAIAKAEADAKAAQRQALLERLGITESEAQLLLGGK